LENPSVDAACAIRQFVQCAASNPARNDSKWHCQTKASWFANPRDRQILGRELTPLCQGGGTIEFEVFAAVKMAFLVEVIVD